MIAMTTNSSIRVNLLELAFAFGFGWQANSSIRVNLLELAFAFGFGWQANSSIRVKQRRRCLRLAFRMDIECAVGYDIGWNRYVVP